MIIRVPLSLGRRAPPRPQCSANSEIRDRGEVRLTPRDTGGPM